MHQLTQIALCALLFICRADEDLPQVTMEVMTSGNNDTTSTATSAVNETSTEELDLSWLDDAIRDVVYYLRNYKFSEYDRRYQKEKPNTNSGYISAFPKPPLRSIHWEVQLHCEASFIHCMEYLNKRVKLTGLRRKDDIATVMYEQNWTRVNNTEQINTVEKECKNMKERDDILANPFQGPIERFKWRTSASYFLCWYAMNEVPYLEHLGEPCDNFANCSSSNKDIRASDTLPFSCILYSLCPDPCCPIAHISSYNECWNSELNPCFLHNSNEQRRCLLNRSRNTDFTDIVLNRWNVTCKCTNAGYGWESRFGGCVDINECAIGNHTCNEASEVCANTPGGYLCVCNWGFAWSTKFERCIESAAMRIVKEPVKERQQGSRIKFSIKAAIRRLFSYISASSSVASKPSVLVMLTIFASLMFDYFK